MNGTDLLQTFQVKEVWVYLAASPLLGLTLTLIAYQLGYALYSRSKFNPLVNPVVIAVALLVALLWVTKTSYATYFEGAQYVHFLLGPATVALAIPLYEQRATIRALWLPLAAGLMAGVCAAIVSAMAVLLLLDASPVSVLSIAPKSVTTAVAMGISERIGGLPSLTAVLVTVTGMIGAMVAKPVLNLLKIEDERIRGLALGVAAHGQGTARAFLVSERMGAYAGLAMGLAAVLTAVIVPLVMWALF
jgi:predicted murein hydrolase (TIGR00659 family)